MKAIPVSVLILIMAITAWCSRKQPERPVTSTLPIAQVPRQNPDQYTVSKGDSLLIISVRVGIPYQTLALWNDLQAPYLIKEGQILRLRAPQEFARVFSTSIPVLAKKVLSQLKQQVTQAGRPRLDWQWPVHGRVVKSFDPETSKGIDISTRTGQPVLAVAAGKVVYAGDSILGYGHLLILKHDEHLLTAYGNNRALRVKLGDEVSQAQVVAEASDNPALAYLHFEVRNDGDPVNPLEYLPPP